MTGEEGGQYGYDDYWDADGVFHYYGAGQVGPMEFVRGNLALRDHAENGEDVHVFEQVQPRRSTAFANAASQASSICAGVSGPTGSRNPFSHGRSSCATP